MRSRSGLATAPAAAFLLASLLAAGVACAPGRRAPPPAPLPGPSWEPSSPVFRRPPLAADPDRDGDPGRFVGSEACLDCHRGRERSLQGSFHAPLRGKGTDARGCEECHGPGIDHVGTGAEEGIRHPGKAPRAESNAVCLRCHQAVLDGPVRGHRTWVGERNLACVSCHVVHAPREERIAAHGRGDLGSAAALAAAGAVDVPPSRCLSCHPAAHPRMGRSGHRELATEGRACGECHGAGSLHAASGGLRGLILLPTRVDAAEADRACVSCHAAGNGPLERWTCSEHRRENVACVACHSPNEPRGRTLRKEDPALCVSCHADTAAEFRLPHRHRVPEGTMRCADCHDPHGNEQGFRRFDLLRETCLRCHPEKGGPFAFDHAAKRLEGCVSCHRPHGSPNPRLLETRDVRTLCLSCHPGLPRSHEQKPGSPFRECLRCHVEIHGSDRSPRFQR